MTVEYGIMHMALKSCIIVDDNDRLTVGIGKEPVSLRQHFPDNPEAGTEAFAWELLEWMKAGGKPFQDGITLGVAPDGVRELSVIRIRPRGEPRFEVEVSMLPCSDVLVDVRGDEQEVAAWKEDFEKRYPEKRFQTVAFDLKPGLVRAWRRQRVFRQALAA